MANDATMRLKYRMLGLGTQAIAEIGRELHQIAKLGLLIWGCLTQHELGMKQ